ncbi:MAG: DUF1573 domain-containing protein [Rikenellaceae bacterium]
MKCKFFVAILLLMPFIISATNQSSLIKFETTDINLGEISISDKIDTLFYFTNTSEKSVVILEVKTFCGCTKVKYNRKPLLSGAKDSIEVTFKPDDKGAFYKKIDIKNSLGEKHILVLKGSVI